MSPIRERRRSLLGLLSLVIVAAADPPLQAAGPETYQQHIKPLLRERCFACHGALKQEANLRLDTVAAMLAGGDSGAAIDRVRPADSLLLERITAEDESLRMPPEGAPLEPTQVDQIREWLAAGASGPDGEQPEPDPRTHWAFIPLRSQPLPTVPTGWSENPIDAWIAAGHRSQGLRPMNEASRRQLIRRVSLDLIGLPPTPAEILAFESDTTPEAWPRLIERLLADPRHGERWARHWMDVWRYTDWYGLGQQLRNSQKHLWHWRDWIIESLNEDKGYDRMILEMLAGDELAPLDQSTLRATGFLARNYYLFNRTTWLDATLEHTSKAFLGLTMNCCKCHDHKYDPLSQQDYYRLRAVFEPYHVRLDPLPGETDLERNGLPRIYDAHLDLPTYLHIRGNDQDPDTSQPMSPGIPEALSFARFEPRSVTLPPSARQPALWDFVRSDQQQRLQAEVSLRRQRLEQARRAASPDSGQSDLVERIISTRPLLTESFRQRDDDRWEYRDGDWEFSELGLRQSRVQKSRSSVRLRQKVPSDFAASFRFRTLGGAVYRSVGLCFDVAAAGEKLVYLSAHAPDPKLQVSYRQADGASSYPPAGKLSQPVELDRTYEILVIVRNQLLNVALDGRVVLAYELPVGRSAGQLELITFDATALLESFRLYALPEDLPLHAAGPVRGADSPEVAEARLRVRECELTTAELQRDQVLAAIDADRAAAMQLNDPPANGDPAEAARDKLDPAALAQAAARITHQLAIAEAELAVAKVDLELAEAGDKADEQLQQKQKSARDSLEKARSASPSPAGEYTSFRASRKALEGPDESEAHRRLPYPAISSGRRTAFAEWIVDRRNPLTARVAVNHIWMRHFGQPLVESVTDLGRRSPRPVQAELLDWLARDLIAHDWSMKRLHRLIVTSKTYRLQSSIIGAEPRTLAADPNNDWYWRRLPQRMESQVIRDSLLATAGVLRQQMYGPSLPATSDTDSGRRSLYFLHSRDAQQPFLTMFDDASILACYRRSESVVPQQALTLANSRLALQASETLAGRLTSELGENCKAPEFAAAAWETVLGSRPTGEELEACVQTYQAIHELLESAGQPAARARARRDLVHALFNHNDFITIR